MGFITWIIFGALVGWVASMLAGTDSEQGGLTNIIVGIVGALIGGFISTSLGGNGVTGFNVTSFLVSLLGAVLLIMVVRAFSRKSV